MIMRKQICSGIGQVVLNAIAAMALVFLVAAGIGNPARAGDADFSGSWDSKTDKGWTYALELKQKGRKVSGTYVAMNGDHGTMKGVVDDDQLELTWKQGEFRGTAQFTMSGDNKSFSGVYTAEDHPSLEAEYLQGTWSGTRKKTSGSNKDFSGFWLTTTDKGWKYNVVIIEQGHNTVAGAYSVQEPNGTPRSEKGSLSGRVKGRVLSFSWKQEPDFTGTGQWTLGDDGKSFTGVYRSDPHPDLPSELRQGTWTGVIE
jgi:hypothetical protein